MQDTTDVERCQSQPSITRATTTEDLGNSVIPRTQNSIIHQSPSDTVGRRCSVDFQNHNRDGRQHRHPCHYEDTSACSKVTHPSSTRKYAGSEEALPRQVNLEETSQQGRHLPEATSAGIASNVGMAKGGKVVPLISWAIWRREEAVVEHGGDLMKLFFPTSSPTTPPPSLPLLHDTRENL